MANDSLAWTHENWVTEKDCVISFFLPEGTQDPRRAFEYMKTCNWDVWPLDEIKDLADNEELLLLKPYLDGLIKDYIASLPQRFLAQIRTCKDLLTDAMEGQNKLQAKVYQLEEHIRAMQAGFNVQNEMTAHYIQQLTIKALKATIKPNILKHFSDDVYECIKCNKLIQAGDRLEHARIHL